MKIAFAAKANIEVKARLADLPAAERTAKRVGARHDGDDRQVDVYFRVPRGRLKLRRSDAVGEQLILYVRPDAAGPRRSDYEILEAPRGGRALEILSRMFDVEVEVRKLRRLWTVGTTRVHLDTVDGLGDFLELETVYPAGDANAEEAARRETARLMDAFGVSEADVVAGSYREMLRRR